MTSTRDAVSRFLQLGAKYELILVGLFDDLKNQHSVIELLATEVKSNSAQVVIDRGRLETLVADLSGLHLAASDVQAALMSLDSEMKAVQRRMRLHTFFGLLAVSISILCVLVNTLFL